MSKLGRFIVLEGLEGAGKSTAVSTIKQFLTENVADFLVTREPGGTVVGEAVRSLVKQSPPHEPLDSRAELLLMYASRVQLVECVIKPALQRGTWVLADRFELSTFAYQGGGRGLDAKMIEQLSDFCLAGFKPDLLIFLDVPPDLGLRRVLKRGHTDRIERESKAFFNAVYDAYHAKLKTMDNVAIIDASQPQAVVQRAILEVLTHDLQQQRAVD